MDSFFDIWKVKEDAIKRSNQHANREWKDEAADCLYEAALQQETLTADDLRERMEAKARATPNFPTTHDTRATGPVMVRGQRAGWISPTNIQRQGRFVSSHGRPQKVWRSLIYRKGPTQRGDQ